MLGNIGYILFLVVATIICFSMYMNIRNEHAKEEIDGAGLSKKAKRAKWHEYSRQLWLYGAVAVLWLILIVALFSDPNGWFVLVATVVLIGVVFYVTHRENNPNLPTANKFLVLALGLGAGLLFGKLISAGAVTYFLGIVVAIVVTACFHFFCKNNIDDLDDEEEEEEEYDEEDDYVEPTSSAAHRTEPARTVQTAARRQSTQPPRTTYVPPKVTTNNNAERPRRRRSKTKAQRDEGDRNFDTYVIEQLSKTEEGRQQLLRMIKQR